MLYRITYVYYRVVHFHKYMNLRKITKNNEIPLSILTIFSFYLVNRATGIEMLDI